jgi:lipid-A-disaccharide synthase
MVGDPSADKHVGKLIEQLRKQIPDLYIWGVGGTKMREQGVELLYDCADLSVLGLFETIHQIPVMMGIADRVFAKMDIQVPDLVLLVDFGGFNLRMATKLRKLYPNLPIYYFISPQVWGSRPWRIKTLARTVTKMLVIFPFEEPLYEDYKVPVKFVGHPLTRNLPAMEDLPSKEDFCASHSLNPNAPIIAIFPGSRKREIADILPISLESILWLRQTRPDLQFVLAPAYESLIEGIHSGINAHGMRDLVGKFLFITKPSDNYALLKACDLVWAKSGTTTLEVTLFGKPMLIYYRALWTTYLVFCILKTVKRVGWPNLLAGYDLVPELIQLDCRAEQLVRYTGDLLDVPELRKEISAKLLSLRNKLGERDYAEEIAAEIVNALSAVAAREPSTSQIGNL